MMLSISGASCVGKDTVVDFLFRIIPKVAFLPSYTTRAPRKGDRGYVYVSDQEFTDMCNRGLFAWEVGPFGNRYGTRISDIVMASLDTETLSISIVVPSAVALFRLWFEKYHCKVTSVYLYCKDENILKERLLIRGDKDIDRRLVECRSWNGIASKHDFFIWVDNSGDLELTKRTLANIIKEAGLLDING